MKAIFVIWLLVLACTAGVSGQGPSKSYFTDTVVVDQDRSERSRLLMDQMVASKTFKIIELTASPEEARAQIRGGHASVDESRLRSIDVIDEDEATGSPEMTRHRHDARLSRHSPARLPRSQVL